jgi:hypothetical protein
LRRLIFFARAPSRLSKPPCNKAAKGYARTLAASRIKIETRPGETAHGLQVLAAVQRDAAAEIRPKIKAGPTKGGRTWLFSRQIFGYIGGPCGRCRANGRDNDQKARGQFMAATSVAPTPRLVHLALRLIERPLISAFGA